jgi:hypothetical protein
MKQTQINEILGSWLKLNEAIRTATEGEAKELLDAEKAGACRRTMLLRIHQRYNVERGRRERAELAKLGMRTR